MLAVRGIPKTKKSKRLALLPPSGVTVHYLKLLTIMRTTKKKVKMAELEYC